jgi:hypothetical protein
MTIIISLGTMGPPLNATMQPRVGHYDVGCLYRHLADA